ncbi:MAG: hypothetical protein LBQ57_14065 [Spirochaetales bacterium]|jgi:hypothetical protein|nr:hypothetical protein [Spirochaetales bacterium]
MSIVFYMGAAIAALAAGLFFALRAYFAARREVSEKETENAALRKSIEARDLYAEKKEKIRVEAEKKKDSLHTSDPNTDFDNSLSVLHDITKPGAPAVKP